MLYKRLSLWYKPETEQAGAQKGRDRVGQILTSRLLSDYAKKSKQNLFLLFIDFEKAYDKVSRYKLLQELTIFGYNPGGGGGCHAQKFRNVCWGWVGGWVGIFFRPCIFFPVQIFLTCKIAYK